MFDAQLLKGKKIVVTGGGTGLGKSMATRFAELGADLVITSRRQNVIDETAKELSEHGGKVLAISCDVRDPEKVEAMVEKTVSKFGKIDILVHSLANGREVAKPLLETSREGYLGAISASSYSNIAMLQKFGPLMNKGGACISLTYLASERIIPGYGGGMSSAKAALESDTRVLAFEAGRKWGIRVNTISAGPLGSRAAKAIGFIDDMINYSMTNAPLSEKPLDAIEVGNTAAFLCSPLASAITGSTVYVDNGLNCMGVATDSKSIPDRS